MKPITIISVITVTIIVGVVAISQVNAQSTGEINSICNVEDRYFRDGVLIYHCEIVNRNGQFIVRETNRDGVVTERLASSVEIFLVSERDCFMRKQLAKNMLATPIAQPVDVQSLATRLKLVEDVIRECAE